MSDGGDDDEERDLGTLCVADVGGSEWKLEEELL